MSGADFLALAPLLMLATGATLIMLQIAFLRSVSLTATLATLTLAQRGFDTRRFFTLDEYYNEDRASYYEALRSVDPKPKT